MNTKKSLILASLSFLTMGMLILTGLQVSAHNSSIKIRLDEINFNKKTDLALQNLVGTNATASAKIRVDLENGSLYDTSIKITVKGAPRQSNQVFEAWLVDDNSGYKLSLGGFRNKSSSSSASLHFRQDLVNFPIYDKLVITEETLNDTNPNPAVSVFSANIPSTIAEMKLRASLLGSNEVPASTSTATGSGKFTINTGNNTLKFDIRFSGLTSTETGAHIHGPALSGTNAGILFTLPADSPKTGTWNYSEDLEDEILSGQTYVNIHSTNFPAGEIRGQIIP